MFYGYNTIAANIIGGVGNMYIASLLAAQENEVLVHSITGLHSSAPEKVHISNATDPAIYNPVALQAVEWAPFLTSNPTVRIPQCAVFTGIQSALPAITVGGVLFDPALGPMHVANRRNPSSTGEVVQQNYVQMADPPYIVPPFSTMYVQMLDSIPISAQSLTINWVVSERVVK